MNRQPGLAQNIFRLLNRIIFQKGLIPVRKSKSGKPRYVRMRPIVIETLKSIPQMIDNPFVFYGHKRGERLKDVPKEWESWLAMAGIKNSRWHDLRHTFASRLVSSGVSLNAVHAFLGNSSIKVTERHSYLAQEYLQQAIDICEIPAQVTTELTPEKSIVA
jgi:integrase